MKKKWDSFYILFCLFLLGTLPINTEAKIIKINQGTQELFLVFKKTDSIANLYLVSPEGRSYSLEKINDGLLATKKYEVIKRTNPLPGNWALSGSEQQINNLLVLFDVSLKTDFSNGTYYNNELLTLNGSLQQEGQVIDSAMLSDQMNMNLEIKNLDRTFSYAIPYADNGLFNNAFILNIPKGRYDVLWTATNTYLSRAYKFTIQIENMPLEQYINADHGALMIKLTKPDLIAPDSVGIKIIYKDLPQKVTTIRSGYSWIMDLYPLCNKPSFSEEDVLIEINARSAEKRKLLFRLSLKGKLCSPDAKPLAMTQKKPKPKPKPKTSAAEIKPKPIAHPSNTISIKFYSIFVTIVLILLAIGFALALFLGIRYKNKLNKIRDEL